MENENKTTAHPSEEYRRKFSFPNLSITDISTCLFDCPYRNGGVPVSDCEGAKTATCTGIQTDRNALLSVHGLLSRTGWTELLTQNPPVCQPTLEFNNTNFPKLS